MADNAFLVVCALALPPIKVSSSFDSWLQLFPLDAQLAARAFYLIETFRHGGWRGYQYKCCRHRSATSPNLRPDRFLRLEYKKLKRLAEEFPAAAGGVRANELPQEGGAELLRHAEELPQQPSLWMRWNYRDTLARHAVAPS